MKTGMQNAESCVVGAGDNVEQIHCQGTYPLPGCETWYESLSNVVQLARKQWVSIESDKEQACYNLLPSKKKWQALPVWLEATFAEVVEFAFLDRIIATGDEAKARLPKTSKRRNVEEVED